MPIEIKSKNFAIRFGKEPESRVPQQAEVKIPNKDYTYAPLRNALLPTPAQLKFALMNVEVDPRGFMDILRRLPEADPHIFSVGNTRQLSILGYDWRIVPGEGLKDNDQERKKCDVIMNMFNKTNFQDCLTGITNGVNYGHAVINPHWLLDSQNRYYPEFESIDLIHFAKKNGKVKMIVDKKDNDFLATIGSNANLTGALDKNQVAQYLSGRDGLVWLDLDEENLLVVNSTPPIMKGVKKDYMGGLMRPGLYLTLLKYYSMLDWAKFNELFGMPLRVGKYDKILSSDDAIKNLKTAVQNLGTDASAVIDKTTEIEFVSEKGAGGRAGNTYETFSELIERKQSMVFLGQNLTAELAGKYGSRAAAKEHTLVRLDYMWSDINATQPLVQKIIDKMYFYNFGMAPQGFTPRFEFFTEEVKDLTAMSGVIDDLTRAGVDDISKSWIYEFFGIKQAENEQDRLSSRTQFFGD